MRTKALVFLLLAGVFASNSLARTDTTAVDPTSVLQNSSCVPEDAFHDDPLVAGTPIKAVHILDLRQAVNCVRVAAGLSSYPWAEAINPGQTPIRASHVYELRDAITDVYEHYGYPTPTFVDTTLYGLTIKALYIRELREKTRAIASVLPTVAAPAIAPGPGTYDVGQAVVITDVDLLATVRYTLDGSIPSEASAAYTSPITLAQPAIVSARAFRNGFWPSTTTVVTYALRVPTPTMTPSGGEFSTNPTVTIADSVAGATIRYTLDRSDPSETSTIYTSAIATADDTTIKAQAFMLGWEPSVVATETYINIALAQMSDASPALVTTPNVSPVGFQLVGQNVSFEISGASLDLSSVAIYRNGERVPETSVSASPSSVTAYAILVDGRNDVELEAVDANGLIVNQAVTLWAGSGAYFRIVNVTSVSGQPIAGAAVTATLETAGNVIQTAATDSLGRAYFNWLPANEMVDYTITATNYRPGNVAALGSGNAQVALDLDNNDFHQNLNGWNVATSRAQLFAHSEASVPLVPCTDCIPRGQPIVMSPQVPGPDDTITLTPDEGQATVQGSASAGDADLVIDTKNVSGPQTVTRTFSVSSGTTNASVRYRFQSDEIWSRYRNGLSYYDDWYIVTVRSLTTGEQVQDTQTISSLLNQFDVNAATPWYTMTLPTNVTADRVEVTMTVANAGDAAHMSILYADLIGEVTYTVANLELRDLIDPNDPYATSRPDKLITYLSTSVMPANLQSYGGNVRVNGTLAITGPPSDSLQDVWLEVWEAGARKASGHLAAATVSNVRSLLLNRPFGTSGVSVVQGATGITPVLFEFPSTEFASVTQTNDTNLELQLHAKNQNGVEIKPYRIRQSFRKLVLYSAANRYGERDLDACLLNVTSTPRNNPPFPCGGDSWALPTVVSFLSSVPDVTWGDFSNMNGGFFPPHQSHRGGLDVDGKYAGYQNRDRASALKMLEYLNLYGLKISTVYVAYSRSDSNAFWMAIKDVDLLDGRKARSVIMPDAGHTTHFHWRLDRSRLQ